MRVRSFIGLLVLVGLLIAGCVAGYLLLYTPQKEAEEKVLTYAAVPLDAVWVQHVTEFGQWRPLSLTQGPLEQLGQRLKEFAGAHYPALLAAESLCSLHEVGKITLNRLFVLALPRIEEDRSPTAWWGSFLAQYQLQEVTSPYNGFLLRTLPLETGIITVCFTEKLMLVSQEAGLLQSALRHLDAGGSLWDNPGFSQAYATINPRKPVKCFLNHAYLPKLIAAYLGKSLQKYGAFAKQTASWTALSGSWEDHLVALEGTTTLSEREHPFLGVVEGQSPQALRAPEVLPANTLAFVSLGVEDVARYEQQYREFLASHKRPAASPADYTAEWIKNLYLTEVALACVPYAGRLEWLGVLHSSHIKQAQMHYALLQPGAQEGVRPNPAAGFPGRWFGPLFAQCEAPYYCFDGSYILFGSKELLTTITRRRAQEAFHSLANNLDATPVGRNVMPNASLTLFLQPTTGVDSLAALMDKRYASQLAVLKERNAQYVLWQLEAADHHLEAHVVGYAHSLDPSPLVPKPKPLKKGAPVWHDSLRTASPPFGVYNHATAKWDTLVQRAVNDQFRVSLRTPEGKTSWNRLHKGPIQDTLVQIDYLNNNKLQMLFAIGDQLFLVDRLGRNVTPYPVTLPAPVAYGPYVFEPQPKEYILALVHTDGTLRMYTQDAQPLPGFAPYELPDYLIAPITRELRDGQYYLVVPTNSQTLYLVQ